MRYFCFCNGTATTVTYTSVPTLSLADALPIEDVVPRRAARAADRQRSRTGGGAERVGRRIEEIEPAARDDAATRETAVVIAEAQIVANGQPLVGIEAADQPVELAVERSEERRVGKECVSTCRSRWSADH